MSWKKSVRARDAHTHAGGEVSPRAQARNEQRDASFKLPSARETNALNASGEEDIRPDAQRHTADLPTHAR